MLPAVLVLVRRSDHREAVLLGRQGHRPPNLGLGAQDRLHDLLGGLVEDLVIVGLEADTDPLLVAVSHGSGALSLKSSSRCGLSKNIPGERGRPYASSDRRSS